MVVAMKRILTLVAAICAIASAASAQEKLVILHTNDTHSHIDPDRGGKNEGQAGIIERAAYIDSVRQAVGAKNVLVVDAGDYDQGSSYHDVFKGDFEPKVLNAIGMDVVTLGNHEFDEGPYDLARRLKTFKFDVVLCNYDIDIPELASQLKPYTIVRKAGLKIGVIGVLTDVTTVVNGDYAALLKYKDPVEPVNRYAELLKKKHCDLVIVLSHLGYENSGDDEGNISDIDLAGQSRNVDVIVGGHSHTFIDVASEVENLDGRKVIVVTDGKFGYEIGKLEIPVSRK